jgi:hypothetical protein
LDFEHLETLPPERIKPLNCSSHVFLPVEAANDSVELEFNTELAAPVTNPEELCHNLARSTTNLNVSLFVKAVSTDP